MALAHDVNGEVEAAAATLPTPQRTQAGQHVHLPITHAQCLIGVSIQFPRTYALVVGEDGEILEERYRFIVETDVHSVAHLVTELLAEVVASAQSYRRVVGVGLSIPGEIHADDSCSVPSLGWERVPLLDEICLPDGLQLSYMNDVEALAVGELYYGVGCQTDAYAVAEIGARVGYVCVRDGHLVPSPTGGYGTTEHLLLAGSHGVCECGHVGCASGALTKKAVLTRTREARAQGRQTKRRPIDYEDLMGLALRGDVFCQKAITEFVHHLSVYLQEIAVATLVRDIVVDGEGVELLRSPWAVLFSDAMQSCAGEGFDPPRIHCRFGGDNRWAWGAATTVVEPSCHRPQRVGMSHTYEAPEDIPLPFPPGDEYFLPSAL